MRVQVKNPPSLQRYGVSVGDKHFGRNAAGRAGIFDFIFCGDVSAGFASDKFRHFIFFSLQCAHIFYNMRILKIPYIKTLKNKEAKDMPAQIIR
jgi:hypothetical protein